MSFSSSKTLQWLIRGLFLITTFSFFALLQTPVRLIVDKAMSGNNLIQDMNGSLFSGQGSWRYAQQVGTLTWQWRWLELFLLRAGYLLEMKSGNSHASGDFSRPFRGGWSVADLSGTLDGPFLSQLYNGWPTTTGVRLKNMDLGWLPAKGFTHAGGELKLDGGKFAMNNSGGQFNMTLPELTAKLTSKDGSLLIDVVDPQNGKFMDLTITPDLMMETKVHQRAVASLPQYQNMPPDSVVLSFKQPVMPAGGQQ